MSRVKGSYATIVDKWRSVAADTDILDRHGHLVVHESTKLWMQTMQGLMDAGFTLSDAFESTKNPILDGTLDDRDYIFPAWTVAETWIHGREFWHLQPISLKAGPQPRFRT